MSTETEVPGRDRAVRPERGSGRGPGRLRRWRFLDSRALFLTATLVPALTILTTFVFWPILYSIYLSFFRTRLFSPVEFVGLEQYRTVLGDPVFWQATRNTLLYTVGSLVVSVAVGLGLALLLQKVVRGTALYRTAFFLPYVVPYAAYALLWFWLLDPRYGFVNYILGHVGVGPVPWLQSGDWVIPAFVLMSVWKRIGFVAVVLLAGLQTVPSELYDAVSVDGGGAWTKFRYVTWPMLLPITLFVSVIQLIYSLQIFIEPYVLTQGGPGTSSVSMAQLLYNQAFGTLNVGQSSVTAVAMLVLIGGCSAVLYRLLNRKED
ncbi:carbohydrate ABC transporter permease [Cellulosimicrobium cellulans]|uniref:carbohydrate ABC transporter permease n=1 Tax=Cellulosimicrobium cellulans TaxID=1710 RepID=UPI00130DD63A|nr:sugar ABC transporter permease [Cellulosimicrobium cellulans]